MLGLRDPQQHVKKEERFLFRKGSRALVSQLPLGMHHSDQVYDLWILGIWASSRMRNRSVVFETLSGIFRDMILHDLP